VARLYSVVDRESWRPFFFPVFTCGVALVLSTPAARELHDLAGGALFSALPIFVTVYTFVLCLFGLTLGAASAERREVGARLLIALGLRVALGGFLCLPFLVFALALSPGRLGALGLVALWTAVVTLIFAIMSRLLEETTRRAAPAGLLARYAAFLACSLVPLAGMPILSPLSAPRLLLDGVSSAQAAIAFGVPGALLGLFALLALRLRGDVRA